MPAGKRPAQPREWVHSLCYSSRRWPKRRRVILVVQETPGELYLHHFFLVTSDKTSPAEAILAHYRQRGTSEARFGEFKSRLEPKLSCTSQRQANAAAAWSANASTFQLYLLADGLLHALPERLREAHRRRVLRERQPRGAAPHPCDGQHTRRGVERAAVDLAPRHACDLTVLQQVHRPARRDDPPPVREVRLGQHAVAGAQVEQGAVRRGEPASTGERHPATVPKTTQRPGDAPRRRARWGRWGLNPRPTDYESAALTG